MEKQYPGRGVSQPLACLSIVLALASCGDSGGYNLERLPEGTNVTISPAETTWEIVPNNQTNPDTGAEFCIPDPSIYQDEFVTVMVTDPTGTALGDVRIVVSIDLAANTYSGEFAPIELYDDRNGDFRPDPDELVSGADDPLLVTSTAEYTGSKNLIVRLNLTCTYRATMQAVAGGYTGSATFDVVPAEQP